MNVRPVAGEAEVLRVRARIVALCLLVACMAVAPDAHGHDPWEALAVSYNPDAPERLALKTNRGVLLSEDHGATWHMLCRTLVGNPVSTIVGVTPGASTLWGLWDGLFTTNVQGCGLQVANTPMSGLWVKDLQRDTKHAGAWVAVTGSGGVQNGVFRSHDDGQSWRALGEKTDAFLNQVRFSNDGSRMYVGTSEYIEVTDSVVYTVRYTDDDGLSWTEHVVAVEPDDYRVDLLGVDPLDPNRIFIGIPACHEGQHRCFDPTMGQKHDRVLVSEDAGATWSLLFEVRELGGFLINENYIWVGDWMGGLWRLTHDGANPTMTAGIYKPACLSMRGDELLVCGGALSDQFLLARSTDNGETFQPLATIHVVEGSPMCESSDSDGGLSYAAICANEWRHLCFAHLAFMDDPTPPRECGGQVSMDAGVPISKPNEGCGCSAVGRNTPGKPYDLMLFGIALAVTAGRFRRRIALTTRARSKARRR